MNETGKFFLKEKPVKALVVIGMEGETYCGEVSEKIDSTYAHTVKLISRMDEFGLLETEKSGRKKIVSLSDEGREQEDILRSLVKHYGLIEGEEGAELGEKETFQ